MSAAPVGAARRLAQSLPLARPRRLERSLPLARLAAFVALSIFVCLHWRGLIADPPDGRLLAATAVVVCGAAATALVGARTRGAGAWGLGGAVWLTALLLALLVTGLPVRLLSPGGWSELGTGVAAGIETIAAASYPYEGGEVWGRLALACGLPLALALAALLAFWPARSGAAVRDLLALAVLITAFGIAATLVPPAAPLLQGAILFLLVSAWLWLPRLPMRRAIAALALIAAAGLMAMPVAARIDRDEPLLDYTGWDISAAGDEGGVFFAWNHTYGPLSWPRTGREMFVARSGTRHYWRVAVLDRFDGFRWSGSSQEPAPGPELPAQVESGAPARLDPGWVTEVEFEVDDMRSQFVVSPGEVLSLRGLGGAIETASGLLLDDGERIAAGENYSLSAYSPTPTPRRMRASGDAAERALLRYTTIDLPRRDAPGSVPPPIGVDGAGPTPLVSGALTVPLRASGAAGRRRAAARLLRSPYAPVYRLARRLSAGAATTYDAVVEIRRHLRATYPYSETPPDRRYPLAAFLFRDRAGYCQQFSGAMALMLRSIGIPSRVATGFSPGTRSGDGFVVSDYDAHSWVEVYFRDIGWVAFDPTPSAAPASSRSPGPRPASLLPKSGALPDRGGASPAGATDARLQARGRGSSPPLLGAGLLALVCGLGWLGVRAARRRSLGDQSMAEAQLAEVHRAMAAVGRPIPAAMTLDRLERRSAEMGRPNLASYLALLRRYRYAGAERPPGLPERRRVRREIARHRGLSGRLRALRAIPPLGPRPVR